MVFSAPRAGEEPYAFEESSMADLENEEAEEFPYSDEDEGVTLEGASGIAGLLKSRRNVIVGAAAVCGVLVVLAVAILFVLFVTEPAEEAESNSDAPDTYGLASIYEKAVASIRKEAEEQKSFMFGRLTLLADSFPARLSGKPNLNLAIDWIRSLMETDGLANVRLQEAMVPVWERNTERIQLLSPTQRPLPMLGLGGSIATPSEGIQGTPLHRTTPHRTHAYTTATHTHKAYTHIHTH